jgi:DNA-binding transcriptional ArsR family regulator
MREFMNIMKALADENRVRMVLALRGEELCVCQITGLFGLAPSTISKHLSILYQAGLVESRKDGRWVYYRPSGKEAPMAVREAIEWVGKSLSANSRIVEDARRTQALSGSSPVQWECCERRQRSKSGAWAPRKRDANRPAR